MKWSGATERPPITRCGTPTIAAASPTRTFEASIQVWTSTGRKAQVLGPLHQFLVAFAEGGLGQPERHVRGPRDHPHTSETAEDQGHGPVLQLGQGHERVEAVAPFEMIDPADPATGALDE